MSDAQHKTQQILLETWRSLEDLHTEQYLPTRPLRKLQSADIGKLKAESTQKFQRKWNEIIAKYSLIDDEVESDEIDLHRGEIVVDNGHLRSLRSHEPGPGGMVYTSIWADTYASKQELMKAGSSKEQKMHRKHSGSPRRPTLTYIDVTNPKSEMLEDNLFILSSSPTKSAPTGLLNFRSSRDVSSRSLPFKPHQFTSRSTGSSPLKRISTFTGDASDDNLESPTKLRRKTASTDQFSLDSRREKRSIASSDLFSVTELYEHLAIDIHTCAFNECSFTSESRSSYRAHLLGTHKAELFQIGYPVLDVKPEVTQKPISELTILKLNLYFPLDVGLSTADPWVCNKQCEGFQCQKMFTSKALLLHHQSAWPKLCSRKRQVLLCPVLGCDYMTESNYAEFVKHTKVHERKVAELSIAGHKDIPLPENISDFFSDTVSSLSFSDSARNVVDSDLPSPDKLLRNQDLETRSLSVLPAFDIVDQNAVPESALAMTKEDTSPAYDLFANIA